MSQDYITMQNLAKKLNVSRNTILNDFETVKDYCLAFNVNVLMKSSKGIKIECDQKDRNNLLMQIFMILKMIIWKKVFSSTDSKKIRYEDSSGNDKRGSERIYGTATYVGV